MAEEKPKAAEPSFDVVMVHAKTDDGHGAKVLRARPGRLECGEVRPMVDGKPLLGGGEVVSLKARDDSQGLYDVKVEHKLDGATPAAEPARSGPGPAQVATDAYRASWERTFAPRSRDAKALN